MSMFEYDDETFSTRFKAYPDFLLKMGFTWTNHAEARLLLQTTFTVVVGHTG